MYRYSGGAQDRRKLKGMGEGGEKRSRRRTAGAAVKSEKKKGLAERRGWG